MPIKLPRGLRALRYRNFRMFIAGQGTAQLGNWLQLIATSWLMYSLTESALMLGVASFALQIPFLVLGPFAGVFLDRLNLRRVLFVTNSLSFVQSLVMLTLVAGGWVRPWHVVVGNLVAGIVNACDATGRQSLMVHLIDERADLPNAIALNASVMNGARFVGPMIGGSVIAALGVDYGFGLNSVLRFAVLAALKALRIDLKRKGPTDAGRYMDQLRAGARYAYGFLPTRSVLLLLAATSFSVQPYASLMPWFAREQFHGDAHTLGLLIGSAGCGAMTGMIYLAARPSTRGLVRQIGATAIIAGCALVVFAQTHELYLAMAMLFVVGTGMMLTAASTNIVLQTIVPDSLRARVSSFYVASFLGMAPVGALFGGWVSTHIGPPYALTLCGCITLIAAALYLRRYPAIREELLPVYRSMGLAPAAAPAPAAAASAPAAAAAAASASAAQPVPADAAAQVSAAATAPSSSQPPH